MVTHNWSNLFRDLLAAILADALQQSTFSLIASLIDTDLSAIERMLSPAALARTYWVCAFSVNQHQSICGENSSGRVDPKTGIEHPVCKCGAEKYFNATPPLRADGRSLRCEMNKFSDMMAFLSATRADFCQVIAVDRHFALFSRAWCVAELARAEKSGMRQLLKLASRQALAESGGRLAGLDVAKMRASRPEDVQEILASIEDVAEFNDHLQEMLFGNEGLFGHWERFDLTEQSAKVGRAAVFAKVLADEDLVAVQV
jgi:hypothetical protein